MRESYRLAEYLKTIKNVCKLLRGQERRVQVWVISTWMRISFNRPRLHEANGAVMISVLTDEVFFKGHLDYLREISSQVNIRH